MLTVMYVQINIFSFVVLLLIFINIFNRKQKFSHELKLFISLLSANALILILDSVMWAVDGRPGILMRDINLIVTALYYISNPFVCMLWFFYVDYQVYGDSGRLKKLLIPTLIPACINTVVAILSMFGNYTFYIDENNVYHRGELFFLMAFISYSYLVYDLIFIIVKQKIIKKKYFIPIFTFAFPPFICGLIQALYYGVSLVWSGMTISILIIFINIQNDQLYTDHLTGLCNRRNLDTYLLTKTKSSKRMLAGIMMDVNSFKLINDSYGHAYGDKALERTGEILRKSLKHEDFIARYGGDEFVIILEIDNISELISAVNNINNNVERFNTQKTMPFSISLSMGYDVFDYKSGISIDEFLNHIDNLMYEDKKNKKESVQMIN